MTERPLAALSVDMDDLWSYQKAAGDKAWEQRASFMSLAMPRLFAALDRHDLGITAFVIGEDIERPEVTPWLQKFVDRGEELANHSFTHDAVLAGSGRDRIEEQLEQVETALWRCFGVRPVGYRGPSFSYSLDLLQALQSRGYEYDCSTFPTFLGPLARWYHRHLSPESVHQGSNSALFGTWREGFRPLKPFRWNLGENALLELPTTTMPFFRLPIHGTYLHFLADRSEALALLYFKMTLNLCQLTGTSPVFLLHASDFLAADDPVAPGLIPGMRRDSKRKLAFSDRILALLAERYRVVPMRVLARAVSLTPLLQEPPNPT